MLRGHGSRRFCRAIDPAVLARLRSGILTLVRGVVTLVAVGIAVAGTPSRATACSCTFAAPAISPADQMTGVPLNAVVIVRFEFASTVSVELRNATTNEVVPLSGELRRPHTSYNGTTFFGVPVAPLSPNTSYVVVANDDTWPEATATFMTGDSIDTTPPAFSGLTAMTPETMTYPIPTEGGSVCISSCIGGGSGHISRIRVEYVDPPSDAVHLTLQLYRPGEDIVDEVPAPSWGERLFGFRSCTTQSPVLEPGADYCGRMVAYDIAGNVAGLGSEVCATANICAPTRAPNAATACEPSDECVPNPEPTPESTGCASTRTAPWVLLALLGLRRRRRR